MRTENFEKEPGRDNRPSGNRSKPGDPPVHPIGSRTGPALPPVPHAFRAALLIASLGPIVCPTPAQAGLMAYTAVFTQPSATPATDITVKYIFQNGNPTEGAGIQTIETNQPNTQFMNGSIILENGLAVGLNEDMNPGINQNNTITVSFDTSDIISSAKAVWSYPDQPNSMTQTGMLTSVSIPEPSSFVMLAIATGVGLVIGRNQFRRTRGRPRQRRR